MNALILYESFFGNTEKVARAIAGQLQTAGKVEVTQVQFAAVNFQGVDLLVLGCPIIQFKPSQGMEDFLAKLTPALVKGLHFACFDTRMKLPKFLTGEAGTTLTTQLEALGAVAILPAERFYVRGRQGPLQDKELEHAANWAKGLADKMAAIEL